MNTPAIELYEVSKSYKSEQILKGFSLKIKKGERIVFFGASGCGKTTLLKMISGLIAPDSGKILINGMTVSENGKIILAPDKRNIGMVFQDLALWHHFSVYGNINFVLKVKGTKKGLRTKMIDEILKLVDLVKYKNYRISQLSGGQKQRVALARALVFNPEIVLMDEPLSSLDIELKLKLQREILKLQQNRFTLIYVTHDPEEALFMGERIVILKSGSIFMDGKPDEIRSYFDKLKTSILI